jgi:hypothetical protein
LRTLRSARRPSRLLGGRGGEAHVEDGRWLRGLKYDAPELFSAGRYPTIRLPRTLLVRRKFPKGRQAVNSIHSRSFRF